MIIGPRSALGTIVRFVTIPSIRSHDDTFSRPHIRPLSAGLHPDQEHTETARETGPIDTEKDLQSPHGF